MSGFEERYAELVGILGADSGERRMIPTGWAEVDAALGGGLVAGALHEWFGIAAAPSGRPPTGLWCTPIGVFVHLAWHVLEARTLSLWTAWVGKRCFPYPNVLVRDRGLDRRLLKRSLFVTTCDTASRLWAIDAALRSPSVGMVIADGSKFPMSATRRIQLLAKRHEKPAFLARPPWERGELSAAQSRWLICWEPHVSSRAALSAGPRWSVELLRCKGVQPDQAHRVWVLEWDSGTSTVNLSAEVAYQARSPQEEAEVRTSRLA